jgi:SAM-dependent methyltransferase
MARDPHRFVNELDPAAIERLIARLENRAKDAVFAGLFDKYAARLALPPTARVLEIGCGTGAMVRSLARRADFSGTACGVDQSAAFIDAARRFAADENLGHCVEFRVGDAHSLDLPDASFDAVIAHTLISHVTDPQAVVREMARVVRPGGVVAIFDGDYASMTYALPDHDSARQMDVRSGNRQFQQSAGHARVAAPDAPPGLARCSRPGAMPWSRSARRVISSRSPRPMPHTWPSPACFPPRQSTPGSPRSDRRWTDGTFFAACNYYTYLASASRLAVLCLARRRYVRPRR